MRAKPSRSARRLSSRSTRRRSTSRRTGARSTRSRGASCCSRLWLALRSSDEPGKTDGAADLGVARDGVLDPDQAARRAGRARAARVRVRRRRPGAAAAAAARDRARPRRRRWSLTWPSRALPPAVNPFALIALARSTAIASAARSTPTTRSTRSTSTRSSSRSGSPIWRRCRCSGSPPARCGCGASCWCSRPSR